MARRLQLEVFDAGTSADGVVELTQAGFETAKLEAYERGYSAGWEDCAKGHEDDLSQIRAELSQALGDAGFTTLEARQAVLRALAPVFDAVTDVMVPELARAGLGVRLREVLEEMARSVTQPRLTVRAAPVHVPMIEEIALSQPALTVIVEADAQYGPGQISLTHETAETSLDLDAVAKGIRAAIADFITTETQKDDT